MTGSNTELSKRRYIDTDRIVDWLSMNNTDIDDEIDQLQELAKQYFLNLYICIINQNQKSYYYMDATSVEVNQTWSRACLVFDKNNRSFYAFYVRNNNSKKHTKFSLDDTHILRLFEDSVEAYKWPGNYDTIKEMPDQDISMIDQEKISTASIDYNTVNHENQPETILNASGVCNLLVQNIQNLMNYIKPQLDSLNFSSITSKYQLPVHHLMSPNTIREALTFQLQKLLEISDLVAKSFTTNRKASTSIESAEASSIVSNESSNSHEEDILPNVRISIEPSLPWNFQSTTSTNTDSLPNTTNIIQQTIKLPKLVLLNQPKRFWHHRESATLSNGCPAIQVEGAPQRTALLLGLPQEIQNYQQEFYIGTHVTTYNGNEHKQKLVVPNNTKIKKNHKSMLNNIGCLEFDEKQKFSVEFDSISKGVFSKVDSNDLENLQKKLTLKMINLYQDTNNNKNIIKEDKLIWCRLMFAIYIKLRIGQFKRVSLPTYSDLIEETHTSQSLGFDNIFPNELCERGGQMIFIKLRESIEKNKLYVHCNGKLLNQNDFQVDKTILSFESPVCTQNRKDVEVTAHIEKTLGYTTYTVPYHLHDDHSEPCGVINED
ncbi:unnamed protein product [Rotaria sordida]|uniref:Uncharacterized protein n=2 Tax=Rotaria sordida TaxID=392033 RepID=A0A818UKG6_9BILA|nr:unnamed protein product [Rotaria sordida]